ncbi:MAG: hypothetical protein AAFQ36_04185 [Pseudomonadota bacterium]
MRPYVVAGADWPEFRNAALEDAGERFFPDGISSGGGSGSGGGGGGGTGITINIDEDTLTDASNLDYEIDYVASAGLGLRREWGLSGGARIRGAVELRYGDVQYTLPDGIGILTDPMRIRFQHVSLLPRFDLWVPVSDGAPFGAYVGAVWARHNVDTKLRSALIRRTGGVTVYERYPVFGLRGRFAEDRADLGLEFRPISEDFLGVGLHLSYRL